MLPVLTGVRIEIDGSTISLLATDRFRLSHRELDWNPRTPDDVAGRAGAGQGARRHRQVADRRQRGHHRAGRPAAPARASSASRARPPAAPAAPRPGCSTASSPRSAACSRPSTRPSALVDKAALIESVKRVALVAERNTAVQLAFSDGVLTLDAGSGDEAQASESIEAEHRRRGHHHRLQPAVPARRAHRHRRAASSSWPSPRPSKPVVISGTSARTAAPDPGVPLPADAAPPALLTLESSSGHVDRPRHHGRRPAWTSDSSASARWAATCATRLRNAGHTVVGYDRNPDVTDVGSLAEMVEQLPAAQGGLGDGARRATRPAHDHHGARRAARRGRPRRRRRQLALDRRPGQRRDARREGHRLRRLRRLRRRLGPGERLRADVRRRRRRRRQGPAGLRRAASPRASSAPCTPARSAPATSPRWSTTASSTP